MINRLLKFPGAFLELTREAGVIASNGSGDLYDWLVNINRLRIESFTRRRFPKCYEQLDGGDIRIMCAFVEREWIANTVSLLAGDGALEPDGEYRIGAEQALLWLKDSFGSLAARDNSFVIQPELDKQANERWFFVNGICTSRELAQQNARALRAAFGREIATIHNPTQGLVHDLVEAALQKLTNINTEPVARAFVEIAGALLSDDVEKVVVLAHSQGTIVMGDVLDLIYCGLDLKYLDRTNMNDQDLEEFLTTSHGTVPAYQVLSRFEALAGKAELVMDKLELYMFANAASRMCYLDAQGCRPHMESFVNERDIVTRLGALAPDAFHREDLIRIDGPVFARRRFGHLLNSHYLPGVHEQQYQLLRAYNGTCIGSSVYDDVKGNPCDHNPRRVAGPATSSRLYRYLSQTSRTELAS